MVPNPCYNCGSTNLEMNIVQKKRFDNVNVFDENLPVHSIQVPVLILRCKSCDCSIEIPRASNNRAIIKAWNEPEAYRNDLRIHFIGFRFMKETIDDTILREIEQKIGGMHYQRMVNA